MRPLRNSPPPDKGRRSNRRSNCSTFNPASAPFDPVKVAVPFNVWVTRKDAISGTFDRKCNTAFALEPAEAEQLAEAAFQIDVGKLKL